MRLAAALFVLAIFVTAAVQANEPLTLVQTIPLDGVQGRIDHMCIDATGTRLYIAALGNNTVEVIDLAISKTVKSLEGLQEPQGIRVLPESQSVVVASGADRMCRIFDASFQLIGQIQHLDDADNVRYDPESKLVYVGYGDGALALIDPSRVELLREVKLNAHPESFQIEKTGSRIFVNLPGSKEIAVVDKHSGEALARWPVTEAEANFPMALDERAHRLYVGCRQPARLLAIDTETGKVLATIACCGDTDDVFIDTSRKRIYVAGGEGFVTVVDCAEADHYTVLANVATAPGARTAYFNESAERIYVAAPHRESSPARILVYRTEP